MNREIKFRGKSIETNEWVYGFYYEIPAPLKCIGKRDEPKGYIVMERPNTVNDWGMPIQMVSVEVDKKTVGEYVGLEDSKRQEVYEGDIILSPWWDDEPQEVEFCGYGFKGRDIRQKIVYGRELYEGIDDLLGGCFGKVFEVIGNIHDNPELLEGEW
ncbi:YopX family protein [Clostridium perfringens]|uniref:YopX family protein n=1 Tax=Clostridium perfringens TaxID=1502 RepID=UPI002449E147|nr:YopX family protein [Clostridium perfringens]MDH2474272.1 YopX family protein [Clostridium perfringens]WVM60015.1 YopX family protein [Clostridium perfringens]